MKTLRTWSFHYTRPENTFLEIEIGRKQCKEPDRTKIYKELQKMLGREDVHSIGYSHVIDGEKVFTGATLEEMLNKMNAHIEAKKLK